MTACRYCFRQMKAMKMILNNRRVFINHRKKKHVNITSCVEELSSPTHEMAKEHDNLAQLEVEARNDFQANLDSIGQHDTFLIQETERCNILF